MSGDSSVHSDLVDAALRVAKTSGRDVADVSLNAIARQAGISRSTLQRRLGGSRKSLDDAVRAAGVDPGGRPPVRERAITAAATLIDEHGLAAVTLEAVAIAAGCSVPSMYTTFGGRSELLLAIFERYSPVVDTEDVLAACDHDDLRGTVLALYREMARVLSREPRVTPAMIAEALARPHASDIQALIAYQTPRVFGGIGAWLTDQVAAGRLRDLPMPILLHQMIGPLTLHLLLRPAFSHLPQVALPDIDQACEIFADTFVAAVGQRDNDHDSSIESKPVNQQTGAEA
ncbi:TetR/AcrR family transcriptional regulator [Mycolicibacterium novocastrense]|uniref:TetR/AcrR family transcriptional regulator n=1 Tax=Mycolicibacterium novocastrense TaxID=59813 RepID=A0AAW5SLD2_MYCNV|nr:TetR/AcrR family transcriptional regulator [Mycolicibacterium novocastrense]MCV7024420.1 TetR/AcrR family transcriptional regulator [Mycolicibacterium novocastrense]GAT12921.1 transcriptional regulator, TetR family protein [Mycolicibacterium novocastrense]